MEWMNSVLVVLAGLGLRLAIPIGITLLAVYTLHKVDVRWQEEAAQLPAQVDVEKPRCWDLHNCPAEKAKACPVPASAEPCWQLHRQANGYLAEVCLNCQVFHKAPIPAPIHAS
jgi:hypothetical protein